jgi:prephenate dehydratase
MTTPRTLRRYAFLGPRGTFADAALRALPASAGAQVQPLPHVLAALDAVRLGHVTGALVPFENSVEGVVTTTVDDLASGDPLVIVDEMAIPVRFALLVRPGTTADQVRRIGSHPHALAQCRNWLDTNLPGAEQVATSSTAGAAEQLASDDGEFDAAVAASVAADVYGLEVYRDGIGDNDEAWTRFVLVQRPGELPPRSGADKTTVSLFMRENHPGALLEILTEFAVRGVNLTRIESRPTRRALGDYYFSIDFEGHVHDARVGEALEGLHRICAEVRFLGSYPRHDGKVPLLRAGVTDQDFAAAEQWLARVRSDGD